MKTLVGVVGGDLRQRYMVDTLKMPIVFFGNDCIFQNDKAFKCSELYELMYSCEIVIVPIPFSKDNKFINTAFIDSPIEIDKFLNHISENNILIGGAFSKEVLSKIHQKGAKVIDITQLETFKLKNAIPTAEGVISELIIKSDITIHKSKVLILGYGYCGKRMTISLDSLGATVDVYTENEFEKDIIKQTRFHLIEKIDSLNNYNFVINTIPKEIIKDDMINQVMLFIDITDAYSNKKDNLITMRGIPGRYSPRTAGKIMGELLNDIIKSVTGENI